MLIVQGLSFWVLILKLLSILGLAGLAALTTRPPKLQLLETPLQGSKRRECNAVL